MKEKLRSDSRIVVSSYILSQGLNLLIHLLIIHTQGKEFYASIGLMYALCMTIIFLSDLGYTHYFLREVPRDNNQAAAWQLALSHKIFTLTSLCLALYIYIDSSEVLSVTGKSFFLAAAPGLILATFNNSALLLALGKTTLSALLTPIQVSAYFVSTMLSLYLKPGDLAFALGISFSIGYLAQFTACFFASQKPNLFLPSLKQGNANQLRSALNIWTLSFSGSIYDRALMIVIEKVEPAFLAPFILLNQLYQGICGAYAHIQKILLRHISTSKKISYSSNMARIPQIILAFYALSLSTTLLAHCIQPSFITEKQFLYASILYLEWAISLIGMSAVTLLIARNKESFLKRVVLTSQGMALAAQLIALLLHQEMLTYLMIRAFAGLGLAYFLYNKLALPNRLLYCFFAVVIFSVSIVSMKFTIITGTVILFLSVFLSQNIRSKGR